MVVSSIYFISQHGNSDPEHGFFINRSSLESHGTSQEKETIDALRLVNDCIVHNGVDKIHIELFIKSSRNASTRCEMFLDKKKKIEMERKTEQERKQEGKKWNKNSSESEI